MTWITLFIQLLSNPQVVELLKLFLDIFKNDPALQAQLKAVAAQMQAQQPPA